MEHPRQVTVIQATAVIISSIIGVGVLPLPLFAARAAGTGAALVTVIALAIAFIGLWLITKLGIRFPRQSIIQYGGTVIGRWPAVLAGMLIIAFLALITSLAAREFGEVVITSVLKRTPLEVTVIVMLVLAALASRSDITTFTYIHHFYLPVILFPCILIVALSLKNSQLVYLNPVTGNGSADLLGGAVTVAALFQGSFVHTMVIPHMRRPERAMLASVWGLAISGGLYLAIVIAAIGVFGPEETKELLWPTLELAKTTTLPGNILERLDAAFLSIWVIAVFTTLLSTYYFTIHSISKLLGWRDHKMLSLFALPYLFGTAMLPQNVLHMYDIITIAGRWGLALTIVYPLLLLAVAKIRKRGGDADGRMRHAAHK